MIHLGVFNNLEVDRDTSAGLFLVDKQGNDVLLPGKYIPEGTEVGDTLRVFIYKDSEDRIVATTLEPKIELHQFAWLKANMITPFGAFLDWGLDKDLLVPFKEQKAKMLKGHYYMVYLYIDDETDRLVATAKLNKVLSNEDLTVEEGEEVEVLMWQRTDLGVKVIINDQHEGLIYTNELFANVGPGDLRKGYIKKIREGNKIDVSLKKEGYAHVEPNAEILLNAIREQEGFIPLTDKSTPEEIYQNLEMSKKTFKKALGFLYKQRLVRLEDNGVYLVD